MSKNEIEMESVSPTEDLLREHGLLNRILIIYDHFCNSSRSQQKKKLKHIRKAAKIVRSFIEDYHEKMEEKYIFPHVFVFDEHLVNELIKQHKLGRELTNVISGDSDNKITEIVEAVSKFTYMYRAHESREDTEIFELFRDNVPQDVIKEISDEFEKSEEKAFGKGGYKRILNKVKRIEKHLGIDNLKVYSV